MSQPQSLQSETEVISPDIEEAGPWCKRCQKAELDKVVDALDWGPVSPPKTWIIKDLLANYDPRNNCGFCRHLARMLGFNIHTDISTGLEAVGEKDYVQYSYQCRFFNFISNSGQDLFPSQYLFQAPPSSESELIFHPYGNRIGSKVDMGVLNGWLSYCKEHPHHQNCAQESTRVLEAEGLRALDCNTRRVSEITADDAYIALSYVWGAPVDEQPATLRSPVTQYPRTIEDVIAVTRGLGIKYLWVDKYCIDQDNPEEKHRLIQRMDEIYANAFVTIIAAAGSNPDHGLPGVSLPRHSQQTVRVGKETFVSVFSTRYCVSNSTWAQRGWTYQEAILSRRRLTFTNFDVHFQCSQRTWVESLPNFPDVTSDFTFDYRIFGKMIGASGMWEWLEEYYPKQLSFDADRIDAVTGIFSAYISEEIIANQFWGIPIHFQHNEGPGCKSFLSGLMWYIKYPKPLEQTSRLPFPSWSWASVTPGNMDTGMVGGHYSAYQVYMDITLTQCDGICVDISTFTEHRMDYKKFQPWVDLTTWRSTSLIGRDFDQPPAPERDWSNQIYLDPGNRLKNGTKLTVALLGGLALPQRGVMSLLFFLAEETKADHFRRVGLWAKTIQYRPWKAMDELYSLSLPDVLTRVAAAHDVIIGPWNWEKEVLRLV